MTFLRLAVLAALACTSRPPGGASLASARVSPAKRALPASPPALTGILPDEAPPFSAATPILRGPGFFRRAYLWGHKRVEITIAAFGQQPGAYERWLASSSDYPQAALSLPGSQANGFFTCASDAEAAPCDLHIQLRAGFHVEAMGNGQVLRTDLSKLVAHVRLGDLSASTFAAL